MYDESERIWNEAFMLLFEESSQLLAQGGFSYLKLSGWYYLPVKNGFLGDLREFF